MNLINSIQIPEDVTDVIKTFIADFEESDRRQKMTYGEDYYRSNNTEIMSRQMLIYAEDDDGNEYAIEDPYKANHKLPAGYFKILVDQKVNYLLGKPITLESEQVDELEEHLGRKFQTTLLQAGKEASKKVVAWTHPYIDDRGEFKLMNIPSEQVIPVYSPYDHALLEMIIRYYKVRVLNSKNQSITVTRVEVWDSEQVTFYQENQETGHYELLSEDDMAEIFGRRYPNPKYHFQKDLNYGKKIYKTQGLSWGQVPFIALYNNDEEEYDLQAVKPFIDAYDIVNSDFCNNLEDFQDIYWILKGYGGENLEKFLYEVKRYKTLKVDEGGDAKAENIDIPYDARKEAREGLERDIFTFGMGVNPNAIGDGNITNVVIKSRFALLDLKASAFELEIKDYIYKVIEFINRFREIKNMKPIELDDITFNRSLIMNEVELLKANTEQRGSISEMTRLSNHPWVDDPEAEIKDMEAEAPREVSIKLEEEEEGDEEGPEEE